MDTREFITRSADETVALGRALAAELTPPKLVLLRGDLGAGKTTLVKGIVEQLGLAAQDEITSPTFTLVHEYHGAKLDLYHIDLYRIDTLRELETLGIDDLLGSTSLLLIEWGEKFRRFEQERDVEISIARLGENGRRLRVEGRAER
jgi:tRNA threonylcarbamoyladenosine biosynthesis protein TsaE